MKKLLAILLAAAMVFALAACGKKAPDENNDPDGPVGSVSPGDKKTELNVALYDEVGDLSPWGTSVVSSTFIRGQIYDTLLRSDYDDPTFHPCAAESYEVSDDGLVYTFHLRHDLVDSKGNEIKAQDVLFSFEKCAEFSIQEMTVSSFDYSKNEVVDDYTVKLGLAAPGRSGFGKLNLVNLVSQKSWEESEGMTNDPVGSGPYKLDDWLVGSTMKLVKNENSWHDIAQFETVNILFIMDASQRTTALQTGEVDIFTHVQISDMDYIDSIDGFSAHTLPSAQVDGLVLNNDPTSICADPNVRKAIIYGIDNQAIVNIVFKGHAYAANSPYSAAAADYTDGWLSSPGYEYNLEKAKEYFAASGLPEGTVLRIACQTAGDQEAIAVCVQSMLKEVGFDVKITSVEASVLDTMLFGQPETWDVLSHFWMCGGPLGGAFGHIEIEIMANFFHVPEGELSDKLNALSSEIAWTLDEAENLRLISELVNLIAEEGLMYGIAYPSFSYAMDSSLQNVTFTADESLNFGLVSTD